jgi:hypothetical protein
MVSQMFDWGLYGFKIVGVSVWVGHHKFHILLYIMNDFDYEEILFIDQEHISLGHKQMFGLEKIITVIYIDIFRPTSELLVASAKSLVSNYDTGVRNVGVLLLFAPTELYNEIFEKLPSVSQVLRNICLFVNLLKKLLHNLLRSQNHCTWTRRQP